jgi:hypothetical protein
LGVIESLGNTTVFFAGEEENSIFGELVKNANGEEATFVGTNAAGEEEDRFTLEGIFFPESGDFGRVRFPEVNVDAVVDNLVNMNAIDLKNLFKSMRNGDNLSLIEVAADEGISEGVEVEVVVF